jgi:hypothetical protein
LPPGAAGENHHRPGNANRNFRAEIFFHQDQSQIDPRGNPARGVDIPVANEDEAGINLNRRVFRRECLRNQPMRRHAPIVQEARGRQNERAGTNGRHAPRPWRHRTHPFDEGWILAGLLGTDATRHDQSIQAVLYVTVAVCRYELDFAMRPDRSRRGGQDNAMVTGLVGSPESGSINPA